MACPFAKHFWTLVIFQVQMVIVFPQLVEWISGLALQSYWFM